MVGIPVSVVRLGQAGTGVLVRVQQLVQMWLVATSVLVVGACAESNEATFGATEEVSAERVAELDRQLRELPSLEETLTEYRGVRETITRRVGAVAPELRWESDALPGDAYPDDRAFCSGEWAHTRGMSIRLDRRVSRVPISDAIWPRAVTIVREVAAEHGMTTQIGYLDRPGNHNLVVGGPGGGTVQLGSMKAAVLSIKAPCRLAAASAVPKSLPASGQ